MPKPKPPPAKQRWFQSRPSPYAWEQDGLDHIERLMPNAEPYRGWATFSFTAVSGRINECDLLIAVPGGLYLVELKGHPGRVVNRGDTWKVYEDGARYPRTLRNPLHLTDLKCKDLKTRLDWALKKRGYKQNTPWIDPAIFLSAKGLRSELDEVQCAKVYGRDEDCDGLPWIWRDLLSKPPQRDNKRVDPEFSQLLPDLLRDIGISAATSHLRFGDDWTLQPDKLDAGPTWEDRLAERSDLVKEEGRVRIYLTAQQATADQRQSVDRAARREYQVLQGINHRGIAQAVQIAHHQGGPAIMFRHRHSDLRLDSYLDVFCEQLTTETRLDLVRQLAEAVQYAHQRSLYHRALSARSVYVSAKDDGSQPVLRITDWQAAARDFDTTSGVSSLGNSSVTGEHLADSAEVYLAPDFDTPYADPVDLDVFGLGTLTYFLLTGQPPATQRRGLIERLRANKGLRPSAVADGVSDELDVLVFEATRNDPNDRLQSADEFLKRLDQAEAQSVPDTAVPSVDPLEVSAGQTLDGGWTVVRVLGTGATARALLVARADEDDGGGKPEHRVFKVALDEEKAERLHAEARALNKVGGGVVVKLLEPPRQLGGRTLLELEYAGGFDLNGQTLGEAIRAEGKLTYHNLERYGRDLFTALDALVGKGVRHRDLKPDNFGVFRRVDRSTQLMLFDFSLAGISERDVKAGTRGYLDPLLGTDRRPVYDDHAERYAAAVTLHEMASGQRPVWGDGMTDPRTTDDETPVLAADLFEPALRDQLNEFFLRAFHRDVDKRFDTFQQMEDAWREVFRKADAAQPITTAETVDIDQSSLEGTRDAYAEAATLDTLLDAAGLSPRAVSVAASFNATTVRELLGVPPYQISKARGSGAAVRKELNRRHKQWLQALLKAAKDDQRPPLEGRLTIDDLAALLVPPSPGRNSKRAEAVRLALGLPDDDGVPKPWPTQSEVAKQLGVTQATVSHHMRAKTKDWADDPNLTAVRDELVALLTDAGRVMTAEELAAALRAQRGSVEQDPARARARALAVVRAAVETETWAGSHSDDEDDEARLQMLRRGGHVVIALESLVGATDPSAPELADFAVKLGARADDLVQQEPLPGRGVVVRELRAVEPPEGLALQADTRLVELAAAMSDNAAASPRLELYPHKLDLVRALRISQAPAGVRRDGGITQQDLLAKVKARFPLLELDERMTHVQLEEALKAAGFQLEYDPADRRFRPPALEPSRLASSSYTTAAGRDARTAGLDPSEVTHAKLSSAVERGGFVALTLRGIHFPGAAEALASVYPVRAVNVDATFLSEFRKLVDERGQDWDKVRRLDGKFSETGEVTRGLASYVSAAWDRVRQCLLEEAQAQSSVLFLHHASLLGRYFNEGGRGLLTGLQNAARRPDDAPHGLWVLCPVESASETPKLEHRIVEVLGESERVVLDEGFLKGLRAGAGSAA